jgi:hypothetical protein
MTQWGLDSLFNPAKRHMDEEKRRLQASREEIGDSSGGKRIDLSSGKVRIKRAGSATAVEDDTDTPDSGTASDGEAISADEEQGETRSGESTASVDEPEAE